MTLGAVSESRFAAFAARSSFRAPLARALFLVR
jgi:hypothetical protein